MQGRLSERPVSVRFLSGQEMLVKVTLPPLIIWRLETGLPAFVSKPWPPV